MIKISLKHLATEISKSLNINTYQVEQLGKRLNTIKDSDKNFHKQESKDLQKKIKQYYEQKNEAAK